MNLEEFYKSAGSSASDTITRLSCNEEMIRSFLKRLLSDSTFSELNQSLDAADTQTAFRMAHTLKGITSNLGLQNLFTQASKVTEFLRSGNLDSARKAMPDLSAEYDNITKMIQEL